MHGIQPPSPSASGGADAPRVRTIAFYLPQFHPIPENDAWWGKGFTEWTNVARARPLFQGHHQPHLPSELGFYDLRLPEVRAAQARLAREHGIHAFCYYYYWFGEKRLLERPLTEVLQSGEPDFPFCICWANESWTRRWDGAEAEVLAAQDDSDEACRRFIQEVMPILTDRRYVRVNGAPLLLVYRVGRMRHPAAVAAHWREAACQAGLPGLYLAAVQSHDPDLDPRTVGFDAAVEFPPSPWKCRRSDSQVKELDPDFTGAIWDYRDLATGCIGREAPPYRLLRGVMTSWDNTARRGPSAQVCHGSTPREYESWLRAAVSWTEEHNPAEERIVFVNAWNEWAEGAHLEPDQRDGRAYLEATARALARGCAWRSAVEALRLGEPLSPEARRRHLADIEFALERFERALARPEPTSLELSDGPPALFDGKAVALEGVTRIERLQGDVPRGRVVLRRGEPLEVAGFAFTPRIEIGKSVGFLLLRSPTGERIFAAPLPKRIQRHDVSFRYREVAEPRFTNQAGFHVRLETGELAPGEYKMAVFQTDQQQVAGNFSEHRVVIEQ